MSSSRSAGSVSRLAAISRSCMDDPLQALAHLRCQPVSIRHCTPCRMSFERRSRLHQRELNVGSMNFISLRCIFTTRRSVSWRYFEKSVADSAAHRFVAMPIRNSATQVRHTAIREQFVAIRLYLGGRYLKLVVNNVRNATSRCKHTLKQRMIVMETTQITAEMCKISQKCHSRYSFGFLRGCA
jgi:hypothetical protein